MGVRLANGALHHTGTDADPTEILAASWSRGTCLGGDGRRKGGRAERRKGCRHGLRPGGFPSFRPSVFPSALPPLDTILPSGPPPRLRSREPPTRRICFVDHNDAVRPDCHRWRDRRPRHPCGGGEPRVDEIFVATGRPANTDGLGSGAGDLILPLVMAMNARMKISRLSHVVYPYPTTVEA